MNSTETGHVSVVIPTYDEAENIVELLKQILALELSLEVIVVDDNSPDGTAAKAESLGDKRVVVLNRVGMRGYGSAVVTGFRHALEGDAQLIVGMDSDFSHDPKLIPAMVHAAEGADVVVGSRYCPDGGTVNWPLHRMAISQTANRYVRSVLGLPCKDSTSGFRCYRRTVLESMDLGAIKSEGYSFLVEILYRAWLKGAKIREIPILFMDRLKGKSKISTREIYRSLFMVLWLRWALGGHKG